jgi:hypothetical protein
LGLWGWAGRTYYVRNMYTLLFMPATYDAILVLICTKMSPLCNTCPGTRMVPDFAYS